jgi:hypothetical protein
MVKIGKFTKELEHWGKTDMKQAGDHLGTLLTARPVMNLDEDSKGVYIVRNTKSYQKCFAFVNIFHHKYVKTSD